MVRTGLFKSKWTTLFLWRFCKFSPNCNDITFVNHRGTHSNHIFSCNKHNFWYVFTNKNISIFIVVVLHHQTRGFKTRRAVISESQEMSDTKLRDAVSNSPLMKKKDVFNKEFNFDSISSSTEEATEQIHFFDCTSTCPCILEAWVPTAAVAAIRCQYKWEGVGQIPLRMQTPLSDTDLLPLQILSPLPLHMETPPVNRQTLLKTLLSLGEGKKRTLNNVYW